MKRQFIFLTLLVFTIISCSKEEMITNIVNYECQESELVSSTAIDTEESQMMMECDNNAVTAKEDILEVLSGTWELVGYAGGWNQPSGYTCIVLSFDGNKLERRTINDDEDITKDYTWELEPYEFNNEVNYSIKIIDGDISYFSMNKFSDNYMYFNHTPVDGDCEIYSPVK